MATRRSRPSREPVPLRFRPTGELADAYARLVEIALRLPGVEESRSYGTPALKVKGKILARLRSEDDGGLALRCDFPEREMLMQADPEVFYLTDHYRDYPMILIDILKVRWDALPQLLEQAWRMVAPARLVREFDGPDS